MTYTYRRLLEDLQKLSEEELDLEAHIHDLRIDAYVEIQSLGTTDVRGDREDWVALPIIIVNGLTVQEADHVEHMKRMHAGEQ
jgi:hypothetical protein